MVRICLRAISSADDPAPRGQCGAYYVGRRYADAANLAVLPGFVTYSLGGSYRFLLKNGTDLIFRLNGDNLTNKRYWATGGNTLNVGASRTVRASLTIDLPS